MTHEVLVTDIKFYELGDIMSKLGGTLTATTAVMTLFIAIFLFRDWEDSVLNSVRLAADGVDAQEIDQNQIKDIVSYSGIYSMWQTVEEHEKKFEI